MAFAVNQRGGGGTATPALSNSSFASASDISLDDSISETSSYAVSSHRQQQQQPQQPRRRRKSDLYEPDSIQAMELKSTISSKGTTSDQRKYNESAAVLVAAGNETHNTVTAIPRLPSLRDAQTFSLRLQQQQQPAAASGITSPKETPTSTVEAHRKNTGSAKCAPTTTTTGGASSPPPPPTAKGLSNALKNFDFSPILQQRNRNTILPMPSSTNNKRRSSNTAAAAATTAPVQTTATRSTEPSTAQQLGEHQTLPIHNNGAVVQPPSHSVAAVASPDSTTSRSRRSTTITTVQEWLRQVAVFLMHVALVVLSWISAVVPAWLLRWVGNARGGTLTLEVFHGVIRLQFSLPTTTTVTTSLGDDEDEEDDDLQFSDPAAKLFQRGEDGGADYHTHKSCASQPPQHDAVGELRRAIQRLDVKVASIQATAADTQSSVSSLEGVVGGLHYLVEQHDASLQELALAASA